VTVAARNTGLLVGSGPGGLPEARLFRQDPDSGSIGPQVGFFSSLVFNPSFTGGVFVACSSGFFGSACDDEIFVGAGPGGAAHVRKFDGEFHREEAGFFAYDVGFTGGVRVAAGDFDQDFLDEFVTAAGPGGGPHVRILRQIVGPVVQSLAEFFAFTPGFTGGVHVAVGDVDGDTVPDIVVGADAGGGPHVRIFTVDPQTGAISALGPGFFAYSPAFTGGVRVAVADVDGTGPAEIVTGAGPGGGPHVRMWKVTPGTGAVAEFGAPGYFAYAPAFTGGVTVTGGFLR
jgi:hypothetical protein